MQKVGNSMRWTHFTQGIRATVFADAAARRRRLGLAAVIGVLAGSISIAGPSTLPALAAPGDAQPLLTTKNGTPSFANPGEVIQYAINYTCSNDNPTPPVDGCDGALFSDPIPKFLDIYGNLVPLEYIDASAPATIWPTGFSLDNSDPQNPRVVGTAGTWAPGTSGVIFVNVTVPRGTVPVLQQTVSNTATVTDPDDNSVDPSTTAVTDIAGATPQWTIGKIGPTLTRMNRNVTWVVSVCTTTNSTLYPIFEITDTIPPGVQFASASNGGVYTDDGQTANISDGAGVVTWTFDANNRPPLGSDGCFRMNVTGSFPSGYVDPVSSDHPNDDNVGAAQKTNIATGVGRNTPTGPTTSIGTAPWTTGLIGAVFGIGDGGTTKRFTDLSGNDNFYTVVGDQGRFNLSGSIDSDLPADTFTITDGINQYYSGTGGNPTSTGNSMPDSFYPTSVLPGTWNAAITARLEGSNDNFANTTVIDSSIASGDAAITLSPSFRSVRLVFDNGVDTVPGTFAVSGMQINGTLGTPAPSNAFGLYTNTSTMSVTRGATTVTASDFDQYILESPLPHPQINKNVANAQRQPGQKIGRAHV